MDDFVSTLLHNFLFDLFLEAGVEIITKILLVFFGRFGDTKRTFRNQLTFRDQCIAMPTFCSTLGVKACKRAIAF